MVCLLDQVQWQPRRCDGRDRRGGGGRSSLPYDNPQQRQNQTNGMSRRSRMLRRCAAGQTYGAQAASFVAPHYGQVGYLSEGVVGTAAALSAVLDRQGWTVNAVVVGIAGMG